MDSALKKINLISCEPLIHISDIKLIRTDTTLDLNQKAEKGTSVKLNPLFFYIHSLFLCFSHMVDDYKRSTNR